MVLKTRLNIKVLSKKDTAQDSSNEELSDIQKKVLKDLGVQSEQEEEKKDIDVREEVVDAIIDTNKMLLYYEYNGEVIIEYLPDACPIILKENLKNIEEKLYQ